MASCEERRCAPSCECARNVTASLSVLGEEWDEALVEEYHLTQAVEREDFRRAGLPPPGEWYKTGCSSGGTFSPGVVSILLL